MDEQAKVELQKQLVEQYEKQQKQQKELEGQALSVSRTLSGQQYVDPFYNRYQPSAREHYQSFLLQAAQVGTNVDKYIIEEVDRMKRELER